MHEFSHALNYLSLSCSYTCIIALFTIYIIIMISYRYVVCYKLNVNTLYIIILSTLNHLLSADQKMNNILEN